MKEIEFDNEELQAAAHWHGGQSSMLYAISSTGSLRCGTIRPRHFDEDRPMTDAEWFADLASRLSSEASDAIESCVQMLLTTDEDELNDLQNDLDALRAIEMKADGAL